MTQFKALVTSGIKDSAGTLTDSLRESARDTGWPSEATRRLGVRAINNELKIAALSPMIGSKEYGDLDNPPSPAIRRWAADESNIEAAIIQTVSKKMESIL